MSLASSLVGPGCANFLFGSRPHKVISRRRLLPDKDKTCLSSDVFVRRFVWLAFGFLTMASS
jgi:hypothetical protein